MLPKVQHDLKRADPYNQHGYAYRVDGQLTRRCLALCHHAPADEGAEEAHGHVDEEYPSPMEIIGDVTAKDRSCDGRDQCSHGPDRSEEHTSELQQLMRISYAVFC